jgi:predicted transcriptional regulator
MSNRRKIEKAKEDILALVSKDRGICSVLLFEAFGKRYTRSHILYFLHAMEKELLIRTYTENKYVYCYLYADDPSSAENRKAREKYLLQNLNRKSDGMIGKVYDVIKTQQGITKAGIAKKLSLYRNTSGYYTKLLEKHGFIVIKDMNRLKCCFTSDYDRDFVYLSASQKELLYVVMKHPGLTEVELRAYTGMGGQNLYRGLKTLLAKGKVVRERKEGVYRYSAKQTKDTEFELFLEKW